MDFPGPVTLMGSGETAALGGQIFEMAARRAAQTHPLTVSVLETPAGFEVNAGRVAGRVAEFIGSRLSNYQPDVRQVAARRRGGPYSTDDPARVEPLYDSDIIFCGPGSPTYAVRQLSGSLTWQVITARQRAGAALVMASAAAIAAGQLALPVYEIFKVGEDPHWKPGLDFFAAYGLSLVIVPHWNNNEGGSEVDTSRCFMGAARFSTLVEALPAGATLLGIDEHTALTVDFAAQACQVSGVGQIHLQSNRGQRDCPPGCTFDIHELGPYALPDPLGDGLPEAVWGRAQYDPQPAAPAAIPEDVLRLVEARSAARQSRDWPEADRLRDEITALGYQVKDTPEGSTVEPLG